MGALSGTDYRRGKNKRTVKTKTKMSKEQILKEEIRTLEEEIEQLTNYIRALILRIEELENEKKSK
jgi:hypothetical protein